jgi:hypothetical protein
MVTVDGQPRHPPGITEGGQFRGSTGADDAAAAQAQAEAHAMNRVREFGSHPGTGLPVIGTEAAAAADRFGGGGG